MVILYAGLCEVSQQQNETQSMGTSSMTGHVLPQHPAVPDQQQQQQQQQGTVGGQAPLTGIIGSGGYGLNESSMTTVVAAAASASLCVPNNTVVSMATMTQPMGQLVSPAPPLQQQQQQQQTARPTYSPSYRGRPRGRRPSGTGPGRGGAAGASSGSGWTGTGGEKRTAASAGLNAAGGVRRPTRGTYRGNWPSRSPSKSSPTGSNQSAVHGSNNSQGMTSVHHPKCFRLD